MANLLLFNALYLLLYTHCSINMKFNEKLNSLLLNKASAALQNESMLELLLVEERVFVKWKRVYVTVSCSLESKLALLCIY